METYKLLSRLNNYIQTLDSHQKSRLQGKLLIEATDKIKELDAAIDKCIAENDREVEELKKQIQSLINQQNDD